MLNVCPIYVVQVIEVSVSVGGWRFVTCLSPASNLFFTGEYGDRAMSLPTI